MRIKDWNRFQHFKDRRPPWIKLYRDLLDDPDWHALDPLAAKVLTMLWLVASEDPDQNGQLPDVRRLAFRLRIEENQLKQALNKLDHWLILDDNNVISERYHVVIPETETETEKRERGRFTPPSVNEVSEYAKQQGYPINATNFVNYYESNGWMVGKNKMKDWRAAVRNWATKDFNKPKQQQIAEVVL